MMPAFNAAGMTVWARASSCRGTQAALVILMDGTIGASHAPTRKRSPTMRYRIGPTIAPLFVIFTKPVLRLYHGWEKRTTFRRMLKNPTFTLRRAQGERVGSCNRCSFSVRAEPVEAREPLFQHPVRGL